MGQRSIGFRAVTNHDRCNDDVIVPEMSDHHGMLEELAKTELGG